MLHMAPERLNNKKYNHKSDVWAIGILYFNLLTGKSVFDGATEDEFRQSVARGLVKFPQKLDLSLDGLNFINGCLQQNIAERLSWEQI